MEKGRRGGVCIREEDCRSAEQLGVVGWGDVFLKPEESLVITLKECVHNLCRGVTVVRMIVVMEVNF